MILWMLWSLLFAALVGIATLAAESIAVFFAVPRRFVWMTAIAVAAVGPVLIATHRVGAAPEPMVLLSVPSDQAGESSPVGGTAPERRPADVAAGPGTTIVPNTAPPMTGASIRRAMTSQAATRWAERLWLLTSLISSVAFLRALALLRRRSSAWRDAEIGLCRALVAPDAGPAVIGFARPRIVIPEWMLSLDRSAQDLMLRHEMEHIRAGDPRTLLAAGTALVVFPWNAALWWLVRRLRTAMELDCDARVIRAVGGPRDYGMVLLAVGERYTMPLPLAASLVEPRSLLERRIRAMTTPRPRRPLLVSLPFAALVLLAVTAASKAPRPAPLAPVIGVRALQPSVAAVVARPVAAVVSVSAVRLESPRVLTTASDLPTTVEPVDVLVRHIAVSPANSSTPSCDAMRTIVSDNFATDLSAYDQLTPGPERALDQYVVLVFDANNNYVRGVYGMGTVGLRVGGDTRPDSERPVGLSQPLCTDPSSSASAGGGGGGTLGAPAAASGNVVSFGVSMRRLPSTGDASGTPVLRIDTLQMQIGMVRAMDVASGGNGFTVVGLDSARLATGATSGTVGIVRRSNCSPDECVRVTPCCAPWTVKPLTAAAGLGGMSRSFLDDRQADSYVLGTEEMRRSGATMEGAVALTPPNQAPGLTSPVRDSSGIEGIPARNIASVDRLRFVAGLVSTAPLIVYIVNLTPGSPHR